MGGHFQRAMGRRTQRQNELGHSASKTAKRKSVEQRGAVLRTVRTELNRNGNGNAQQQHPDTLTKHKNVRIWILQSVLVGLCMEKEKWMEIELQSDTLWKQPHAQNNEEKNKRKRRSLQNGPRCIVEHKKARCHTVAGRGFGTKNKQTSIVVTLGVRGHSSGSEGEREREIDTSNVDSQCGLPGHIRSVDSQCPHYRRYQEMPQSGPKRGRKGKRSESNGTKQYKV